MPEAGFLIDICDGIIIAQMEQNLWAEKDLYYLLLYILRSPESILKITGPFWKDLIKEEMKFNWKPIQELLDSKKFR